TSGVPETSLTTTLDITNVSVSFASTFTAGGSGNASQLPSPPFRTAHGVPGPAVTVTSAALGGDTRAVDELAGPGGSTISMRVTSAAAPRRLAADSVS